MAVPNCRREGLYFTFCIGYYRIVNTNYSLIDRLLTGLVMTIDDSPQGLRIIKRLGAGSPRFLMLEGELSRACLHNLCTPVLSKIPIHTARSGFTMQWDIRDSC